MYFKWCIIIVLLIQTSCLRTENVDVLSKALDFLQNKNGNTFHSVVVLSDPSDLVMDEYKIKQDIRQYFYNQSEIFWVDISAQNLESHDVTTSLTNILDIHYSSIVIIFDLTTSSVIQQGFATMSSEYLRNNTWLIVTNSNRTLVNVKLFFTHVSYTNLIDHENTNNLE